MVTIPFTERTNQAKMLAYFFSDIGGCLNPIDAVTNEYAPQQINGGELDRFTGYIGHNAEKHVSWTIAIGGKCLYVEMIPPSCETAALLMLS